MPCPRDVLTPEGLSMLQVIADTGSFAAAARQLNLVPSALTYRVRQIEDALDVLLFDRSSRQARPTPAGQALLTESVRLLQDMDAVAHRVRRVATGWEPALTVVADGVISQSTLFDLVEAFYALHPPTKLKLGIEILSGTINALIGGRADLAIGISTLASDISGLQVQDLGDVRFAFAVAPFHPLAHIADPISDAQMQAYRLIAVADSAPYAGVSMGLLSGQDTCTVETMQAKIDAQVRGLGCGFLPDSILRPYVQAGLLVIKQVQRPTREIRMRYAWKLSDHAEPGHALRWWLQQLESGTTRRALLDNHHPLISPRMQK